jgi:hypothetical protein
LFAIISAGNFISWQYRKRAQAYFNGCFSLTTNRKKGIESAKLLLTIKIKLLLMIKISLPFVSTHITALSIIPPPETSLPCSFLIVVDKKLCV